MHSFKLNRRKRWWRCLGAVRSVISSRGYKPERRCLRAPGPWGEQRPRRHSSGTRSQSALACAPGTGPVSGSAAPPPPQVMSEFQPSLCYLAMRLCHPASASAVPSCPSPLTVPDPRHVSHGWYPSPVTHTELIHCWPCLPSSIDAHPSTPPWNVLLPWTQRTVPPSPCGEQGHFFYDSLSKVSPSQLFSVYSEASFWSWYVCVLFLIISNSSGPHLTGQGGLRGQARVLSFLASVEQSWPTHWRDRAGTALVFQADSRARCGNRLRKPRRGAAMLCSHPQGAPVGKSVYLPTGTLTNNTTTGTMPISEFWVRKESFRARNLLKTFGR